MLSMSKPFIKKSKGEEIGKKLQSAVSCMREKKLSIYVEKKLFEAEDELHQAAKHLLLPISTETITEWDEEEFARDSDI